MTTKHVPLGSVSWGTHRLQDLMPRFLGVLRYLDEKRAEEFEQDIPAEAWDDEDHEWWTSEEASYLLEDLFDVLNEFSPSGYYFGAHPGDGANFGWWEYADKGGDYTDVWLCEDCTIAAVHDDYSGMESDERVQEVQEGLENLGHISPNFYEDQGYDSFSWEPCDACGTSLGGARYRFALWLDDENAEQEE